MTFNKSKDNYRDRVLNPQSPEEQITNNIPYVKSVKRWNKKRRIHFSHKEHKGTKLIKR